MYSDAQMLKKLVRHLERILIIDGHSAGARLLSSLLQDLGAKQIVIEPNDTYCLEICEHLSPQIIFTELTGPSLDGLKFTRALRRSHLVCRKAPVIVVTAEATASAIVASRDAGVHEFLRKPFTVNDLIRRLDAVALRSRDWIEAVKYIGPDRRRFNSGDYQGTRKRQDDHPRESDAARIGQALKILKSAIDALESDPVQAMRSMQAQVAILKSIALDGAAFELAAVVAQLQRRLAAVTAKGGLVRADIEAAAAGLWAFLPPEPAPDENKTEAA